MRIGGMRSEAFRRTCGAAMAAAPYTGGNAGRGCLRASGDTLSRGAPGLPYDDDPMTENGIVTRTSFPPGSLAPQPMMHGDPCTIVIFGGAGDLSRRKLLPAIFDLFKKKLLDDSFRVVGVGIEKLADDTYRAMAREAAEKSEEVKFEAAEWALFEPHLHWQGANLTDVKTYDGLATRLTEFESRIPERKRNRLFYLAVPPPIFHDIVHSLQASGLAPRQKARARPWVRVVVEKPFGRDLASARALGETVLAAFDEGQVYRIDHYVGKETVQNVLVLRSANALFEALWSKEHISHVEISAAEKVGLEGRGGYYETSGVVRDMFQNHLLQLVALTAMEPPETASADHVRDEKVKVLKAIKPLVVEGKTTAVRGQYAAGEIDGAPFVGYRQEPGVKSDSRTPTFAALRLEIDTERWRGVPFYLRSGKRMAKRVSEIAIHFKAPRKLMYEPCASEVLEPNVLVLRLQPNDGVSLSFEVKVPGAALALTPGIEVTPVEMSFSYSSVFGTDTYPAYETLLLDVMIGDATLFTRTDEVEAAWRLIDPLLELFDQDPSPLPTYAAGSWGPREANALLGKDGFAWRTPLTPPKTPEPPANPAKSKAPEQGAP